MIRTSAESLPLTETLLMEDLHAVPGILRHLYRLTGYLPYKAQRIGYVRVYSRLKDDTPASALHRTAPAIEVYPADDQGFEGIACVDDVGRAATLALQLYEMTQSQEALRLACDWLRFLVYMQSNTDQRLLNFILEEGGTRNGTGKTSYPGGEPWTVRALQAYAAAWRVLRDESYLRRFWQTPFPPTGNMKYTSVYALATMDIYQTLPDRGLEQWITDMCEAILASGPRYFRDMCGKEEVEPYGYFQLAAMARAGRLLSRPEYLTACADTVTHLVEPVIKEGFYHSYPDARDPQSVFDISPLALGLEELYIATDNRRYRDLALQCVAWLDGNNPAGVPVYDPRTGRCNDKVHLSGEVDVKVGAESAIEAGFLQLVRCRITDCQEGLLADPAK
jgi:hypothetical protein